MPNLDLLIAPVDEYLIVLAYSVCEHFIFQHIRFINLTHSIQSTLLAYVGSSHFFPNEVVTLCCPDQARRHTMVV